MDKLTPTPTALESNSSPSIIRESAISKQRTDLDDSILDVKQDYLAPTLDKSSKRDDLVLCMPKIFTKLLKRAMTKLSPKQDELQICIQIKQAFFNVLLLIMAIISSNIFDEMLDDRLGLR